MKECRILPADFDIMGMRGTYHKDRILELVHRFNIWRKERIPGVRAFQSTYDRFDPMLQRVLSFDSIFKGLGSLSANGFINPCMMCMPTPSLIIFYPSWHVLVLLSSGLYLWIPIFSARIVSIHRRYV